MTFVKRQDKVMFIGAAAGDYYRMKGFTNITTNKNPKEYTRHYVDDLFETTDVTAISTSVDWEFDQRTSDPGHEILVEIIDKEAIGDDAIVSLIQVDMTQAGTGADTFVATKREVAVIPASEGGSKDAYSYSGSFKTKGDKITGEATTTDGWKTCTFTPNSN